MSRAPPSRTAAMRVPERGNTNTHRSASRYSTGKLPKAETKPARPITEMNLGAKAVDEESDWHEGGPGTCREGSACGHGIHPEVPWELGSSHAHMKGYAHMGSPHIEHGICPACRALYSPQPRTGRSAPGSHQASSHSTNEVTSPSREPYRPAVESHPETEAKGGQRV